MATRGNKPNNIIAIPTTLDKLFRYWVEFLRPLHHLTDREMDIITAFLKKRYELSKSILDPVMLDKYLMNEETKAEIREECGATPALYYIIMGKLKKAGIIVDGRIHPKFIPNIKQDGDTFQLLLLFPIKDEVS